MRRRRGIRYLCFAKNLSSLPPADVSTDALAPCVAATLAGLYDDGLEVPFLWLYRRETVAPLPGHTLAHVWAVLDLDDAWIRVMSAKAAVAQSIDDAVAARRCTDAVASRISDLLAGAASERAAADVARFAAHVLECGGGLTEEEEEAAKADAARAAALALIPGAAGGAAPVRGPAAAISNDVVRLAASSAEVRKIVSALYVSPEGLAANMRASSQVYAPPDLGGGSDTEDALQAIAFEALSDKFTTHEEVLNAAQLLAATGIAAGAWRVLGAAEFGSPTASAPPAEPFIRSAMRRHYFERALVSTAPTPRGRLEIDGDHPYFGVHTLAGKGIKDFSVFLVRGGR